MALLSDGVLVNPLVEETIAKSNLLWLRAGTIFLTRHGSHAYGTNIESSDEDYKGVAVPPAKYFLGFVNRFDQAEFRDPNPDMVIYDLRKFMALAADCNPNIIEMLWTDPSDHLLCTKLGERLIEARETFMSRKAKHTFSGYALSQLKRINTHYRWLKNPPKAMPTREEFGLPERTVIPADQLEAAAAAIRKQLDRWSFKDLEEVDEATRIGIVNSMAEALSEMKIGADEQFRAAGRLLGYADNFLELLDRERHYNGQKTEWQQYQNWKKTRNPARAELEEKWGYDTKHAGHLVRLLRMCREILTTGKVVVKRPDRDELLAIRNGAWKYEDLVAWATKQDEELTLVMKESSLPHAPDRNKLDALCQSLVEEALGMKGAVS